MKPKELKKNLGSATNSMKANEKILLTAEEVCIILKTCGEAKVAELQFGPLHVWFDKSVAKIVKEECPIPLPATEIAETQEIIAKEAHIEEEIRTREDQVAELWITNPQKAEEMVLKGELEEISNGDRTEET